MQQSYYAGQSIDRREEGQSKNWSPWPWNPIGVGDAFGNSGKVLDSYNKDGEIYSKSQPLLWDMENELAECYFENWVKLNKNTVEVRCKLTTFRTDDRWKITKNHQELPAVYSIGDLHNLWTYKGDAPFTSAPLTKIPRVPPPWTYWGKGEEKHENWAALCNNDDWGFGVYMPSTEFFIGGFSGKPGGKTNDNPTGYISPLRSLTLQKDTVFEYSFVLILGELQDIRDYVYTAEGKKLNPPADSPSE